jgi:hypothetical protein
VWRVEGPVFALGAEDVLNRLRSNVLVVASDGTIRGAYGGGGTMAGHPNQDVVGRNALDFLAPRSQEALINVFLPGDVVPIVPHPTSFPVVIVRPDGAYEEYDLVPSGYDGGSDRGWVVLLTSRLHLPPAIEVLHSMSHGDSLDETIAGVTRRMSEDVPDMPDVVRCAVSVLYPAARRRA